MDATNTQTTGKGGVEQPEHNTAWLIEAFTERLLSVGGTPYEAADIEAAASLIATLDVPSLTGRFTATQAVVEAYPGLRAALDAKGAALRVAEEVAHDGLTASEGAAALAGDKGIILAVLGVAETGSFLASDQTLPARLTGMLSDSVFALLPASQIAPTLDDMGRYLAKLSGEGRRYLSIVTGPSRTADIERVLTIGVQGPKTMNVIILHNV